MKPTLSNHDDDGNDTVGTKNLLNKTIALDVHLLLSTFLWCRL